MEYNTAREQLQLPEYGRNIQKLVSHLQTINDKAERTRLAAQVIRVMEVLNPHFKNNEEFKHKQWDHLIIMSDFNLDIDFPYEMPTKEQFHEKPTKLPYSGGKIKFRHYGSYIQRFIETLTQEPHGKEREAKTILLANQMKKVATQWKQEVVSDDQIRNDLKSLSGGILSLPKEVKLANQIPPTNNQVRKKGGKYRNNSKPRPKSNGKFTPK